MRDKIATLYYIDASEVRLDVPLSSRVGVESLDLFTVDVLK
jgi:hypothetical protein